MDFNQHRVVNDVVAGNNGNYTVIPPALGMLFDNGQEFADLCHAFASHCGFQFFSRSFAHIDVFWATTRKPGREPQYHLLKRLKLACSKASNISGRLNQRPHVTDCKVFVYAGLQKGKMIILALNLDHNHPMDPPDSPSMIMYKHKTASGREDYKLKNKNSHEIVRDQKNVGASKRNLEEVKNLELINRIQVLESEKEGMVGMRNKERVELAKRIVELDAGWDELKEDKEKCARGIEKCMEAKGKFDSDKQKWMVEEAKLREKCRRLEVEKKKLDIDLKEAAREKATGDEAVI